MSKRKSANMSLSSHNFDGESFNPFEMFEDLNVQIQMDALNNQNILAAIAKTSYQLEILKFHPLFNNQFDAYNKNDKNNKNNEDDEDDESDSINQATHIHFLEFIGIELHKWALKNITKNQNWQKGLTLTDFREMKQNEEKISMLTCYDASMANICRQVGVDILLVGDSFGNVIKGQSSTLSVSMNETIYHTKAVRRGAQDLFVIADMPFGAYPNPEKAYEAAAELIAAGANMVKLEGTSFLPEIIEYLGVRGIPTCAHIGLIPQFVHKLGGMKMQGKTQEDAQELKKLAQRLLEAGVDMLLFEAIPATLAAEITEMTKSYGIPTIGIGAGGDCDGQVLVSHDILGLSKHIPKFAKNYLAEWVLQIGALEQKIAAYKKMLDQGDEEIEDLAKDDLEIMEVFFKELKSCSVHSAVALYNHHVKHPVSKIIKIIADELANKPAKNTANKTAKNTAKSTAKKLAKKSTKKTL